MENIVMWFSAICILALRFPNFIYSLRLVEIRVPNYVIKDANTQLECLYDLEGEALYSVKWYKDGNEFYRYMPMGLPKVETFPLPGVDVDLHTSHEANVTLNELSFQSSGRYRCEISAEAPSFQTVTDSASMIVVVLPEHGNPHILGARPRYQIGDWVQVNCTAGPSKPAVELTWYINNEQAEKHNLHTYPTIITGRDEYETSTLGLQFRVEAYLFRNGDLRLKCVASLSTYYWRSNEEVIEADRPQKAHVLDASIYMINSGADPVLGTSTRESFATKFLSMITPANTANSTKANAKASTSHFCLALLVACSGIITELVDKSLRKLVSIEINGTHNCSAPSKTATCCIGHQGGECQHSHLPVMASRKRKSSTASRHASRVT